MSINNKFILTTEEGSGFHIEKQWYYNGLECCVGVINIGHRLGYVLVSPGIEFDSSEIECHGGLTKDDETGEKGRLIGFDCAHSEDGVISKNELEKLFDIALPVPFELCPRSSGKAKGLDFCIEQCKTIVDQIV